MQHTSFLRCLTAGRGPLPRLAKIKELAWETQTAQWQTVCHRLGGVHTECFKNIAINILQETLKIFNNKRPIL